MKNRAILTLLSPLVAIAGVDAKEAASVSSPDILFLFIDDMTFDGIQALGDRAIMTPNMDRIVKSGVNFTNTYNMGGWSGALSVASRTQLMTGLSVWHSYAQHKEDKFQGMISDGQMWAQRMQSEGYKCYHTGKWHVWDVEVDDVFEEYEGVRPAMPGDNRRTTKLGYNRPLSPEDTSWQPWDMSQGGYWDGGKHWSEVQADLMIAYMERNKESEKPLFMTCAFNAPHDPRQSPEKYVEMYSVEDIEVPESFQPQHPYMEQMRSGKSVRDEQLAPFPRTEYAVQKHIQEYYSIITHLDDQIGRILEALEKCGRADNTLIVMTADNGLAMGRHGFIGKQSLYEHSLKIPFVIAGCGLPKNESRSQMIYMQDVVPTLDELLGFEGAERTDFVSFLDIAKNKRVESKHEYIFGTYMDKQRMISDGRYKLYIITGVEERYLFDLKKDPEEMTNLYSDPKYKDTIKRLSAALVENAEKLGDTYDYSKL